MQLQGRAYGLWGLVFCFSQEASRSLGERFLALLLSRLLARGDVSLHFRTPGEFLQTPCAQRTLLDGMLSAAVDRGWLLACLTPPRLACGEMHGCTGWESKIIDGKVVYIDHANQVRVASPTDSARYVHELNRCVGPSRFAPDVILHIGGGFVAPP